MQIINFEVLVTIGVAAFVVAKIYEAIKERMGARWDNLSDTGKEVGGYVMVLISAALMWLTGLDMLPGFGTVVPWAGRVLTCIVGGFGPSVVYDIWLDRPEPPTP